MSDPHAEGNEQDRTSNATDHVEPEEAHHQPEDRIAAIAGELLDRGDSIVYAIVGICFFLGGIFALGYSLWDFVTAIQNPTGPGAISNPWSLFLPAAT